MAASYIKILKSYANFTNLFLKETAENQRMAASISLPLLILDKLYAAGGLVPSTRKHGSWVRVSIFCLDFSKI